MSSYLPDLEAPSVSCVLGDIAGGHISGLLQTEVLQKGQQRGHFLSPMENADIGGGHISRLIHSARLQLGQQSGHSVLETKAIETDKIEDYAKYRRRNLRELDANKDLSLPTG